MTIYLKVPHTSRILGSRGHKLRVEEAGWQRNLTRFKMGKIKTQELTRFKFGITNTQVPPHLNEIKVLLE